jgi:hypothetical protein
MVSSGSTAGCTTVHPLPTPSECPYACAAGGMHCPTTEPLELIVAARQQRDRWVPSFDAVEARVAHETVCTACGGRLSYVGLSPPDNGSLASAWAICCVCRHWVVL